MVIHFISKYGVLIFPYLSEENGMDQENPAGEEELAVLALYKTLQQNAGRWDHPLYIITVPQILVDDSMRKEFLCWNREIAACRQV